jgi:hypothetical protein
MNKTVMIKRPCNLDDMKQSLIRGYEKHIEQITKNIERMTNGLEQDKKHLEEIRKNAYIMPTNIEFSFNNCFVQESHFCECCGDWFEWGDAKIHLYEKDTTNDVCVDCALFLDPSLRARVAEANHVYGFNLNDHIIYPICEIKSENEITEADKPFIVKQTVPQSYPNVLGDDLNDAFPISDKTN